jgi:SPASM domain peptide maturase of grasp-with-spasm system
MLVKGHHRSVILDIQRGILDFIPNELYEIYQKYNKQEVNYILSYYNPEEQEIVQEYIDFLLKNEYAILGTEHDVKHIVDLPTSYNYCGQITNCVCEYSSFLKENIRLVLNTIDKQLGCSAFQLLCPTKVSIADLNAFLKNCTDLIYISHIEIIMPYSIEYTGNTLDKFLHANWLVNRIILFNSPVDKVDDRTHSFIIHTRQNFSPFRCGLVSKEYFTQNMFHITEAMNHNTCLHKKLSIDGEGNIKNCLFSDENFGNILENNILDITKSKSFTKHWNTHKDKIEVCKDCEFRYVCTDCRTFIKKPGNIFSQPLYCTYNPYIAKWENEKDYVPVEESLKELQIAQ